jgi:hypothetical protein
LCEHKLATKRYARAPTLTIFAVLVSRKAGPFMVRREYEISHAQFDEPRE